MDLVNSTIPIIAWLMREIGLWTNFMGMGRSIMISHPASSAPLITRTSKTYRKSGSSTKALLFVILSRDLAN
jgi:hypothetical protein